MTRIIGIPGPLPGGQIGFGVNAPPPATPPGAAGCACSDLAVAWFNGTEFAVSLTSDDVEPSFAATGTICPDTTWSVAPSWAPDDGGAEPTVRQYGASAWTVDGATATGILTLTVTAMCGGVSFNVGTLFLTVLQGEYNVGCSPPTLYQNILNTGCIAAVLHGDTSDITLGSGSEFSTFFIGPRVPFYQNGGGTVSTQTCISFDGLAALFGTSDMDVRVTVIDNEFPVGHTLGTYIDNRWSGDFTEPLTGSWEYTVANADIDDWFTGAGTGDGAGAGTGSCEFKIEIKVH